MDSDVILKFEIRSGISPDVSSVTEAIEAWADIMRTSASIIEPDTILSVKLVGVESGSQVFIFALDKLELFGNRVIAGGKKYPLVSKAAMSLSALIGGTLVTAALTNAVTPDARIPDDQMQVFKEMNEHLGESVVLQKRTQRFFERLDREPAFDAIRVLESDGRQIYQVPRQEFLPRSGFWSGGEMDKRPRNEGRRDSWDVTLIRPVMVSKPRRWTFMRDGVEFSALMEDPFVLDAIQNRTLGIHIAEGVRLRVVVEWMERYDGSAWKPIISSRKIKKVTNLLPPAASVPLFATSRS